MSGRRHRSNCELVGQGIANFCSALFGGLPATGTVARTATNIRAGAKSPLAGMMHSVIVLICMLTFAPLASYIPLASLAAVLVVVAWNMSERDKLRMLMRAPSGDAFIVVVTFALTVLVDLPTAIAVGTVTGAILFMYRMTKAVEIRAGIVDDEVDDLVTPEGTSLQSNLPNGVAAFQVRGPLFFGIATQFLDVLSLTSPAPKVFILRLGLVPMIDASGAVALQEFIRRCHKQSIEVILSGVKPSLRKLMREMNVTQHVGNVHFAENFSEAINKAHRVKWNDRYQTEAGAPTSPK
jgi:SulP family sulfate permease